MRLRIKEANISKTNLGKCRLCLKDSVLVRSHIIPEWCYDYLYDEKHRTFMVSTIKETKTRIVHRGIREKLLCVKCEGKLSKYETYARELIFGRVPIKIKQEKYCYVLTGIDYPKLKLFQLSIIWRSSISQLPEFKGVELGPHQETIRNMLFMDDPGSWLDYGCTMAVLLNDDGKLLKEILIVPEKLKIDGIKCYRFIFAGCTWIFVITSKAEKFRFTKLFLHEDGKMIMLRIPAGKTELFIEMGWELFLQGKTK